VTACDRETSFSFVADADIIFLPCGFFYIFFLLSFFLA